ncbi:MAG: DUF930 domain-containing protein [Rhizobiaceae bacterium]
MSQTDDKTKSQLTSGTVVSVSIHAVVLAFLIFGLPESRLETQEPESIEVEIVKAPELADEKAASPPPPPPPPPPPSPKVEEKPEPQSVPKVEEPEEEKKPQVPPTNVMQPVFKFAEEDAGSKNPQDGEVEGEELKENDVPEEMTDKEEEPVEVEVAEPEEPVTEDVAEAQEPSDEIDSAFVAPNIESVPIPVARPAPPKPARVAKARRTQPGNEGPVATTAKRNLPRGIRAGKLCVTELRRRLNIAQPPFWPDLLPTYQIKSGNVLQVRRGAFRADSLWYNLQFRCEVDPAATEVVSFAFNVGSPIPRHEWSSRGFPAF